MNTVDAIRFLAGIGMAVPLPEERDRMAVESRLIPISASQFPVIPFPPNDSLEAQNELRYLVRLQKDKSRDLEFAYKADKDVAAPFKEYAEANGLEVPEGYLDALVREAVPLLLTLKFQYGRPRPGRLAFMYGIDFKPYETKTADTPAYPSGHAFQAYLLAYVLGRSYPAHANRLERIAERVGQSRMDLGLHFPSDVETAKVFAFQAAQSVAR
jgi:PAP2 superfamily